MNNSPFTAFRNLLNFFTFLISILCLFTVQLSAQKGEKVDIATLKGSFALANLLELQGDLSASLANADFDVRTIGSAPLSGSVHKAIKNKVVSTAPGALTASGAVAATESAATTIGFYE